MMNDPDICDAGSLTLSDGLSVLLNRKLDPLPPGQTLRVRSSDPGSLHDVRAWARMTGHHIASYEEGEGEQHFLIRRGSVQRVITAVPADWNNRASIDDGRF